MRQTSNHGVCAKSNRRNRQVLLSGCTAIAIQFESRAALAQDGRTPCHDTACAPAIRGKVLDDSTAKGARIAPNVEQEGDRGAGKIPFLISVDGQPVVESGKTSPGGPASSVEKQRRTDVGLSAVDIQVKFDGLDAKPILNISTVPIRRSYRAGDTVRFLATSNYPSFIRRAEIRIIAEDEDISEVPAAVVPVAVNGEAQWVMPQSDKEEAKRFHYVLRVYDGEGRYDETGPRSLARSARELPEEGKITDAPVPGMAEDNTALRNIPISGGAVTVYGRNVPEGYQVHALDGVVPLDRNNAFVLQRILPAGDHDVDVSVRGTSKTSALEFNRAIHIPKNDWFFVGLADLTVGKRMGDKGIESVREGEYDSVYTKGLVAFYLKGKIKGKYLLTAAADTGEDELKDIFRNLDDKNPRDILRRLDPEDFYPVYGDDSTVFEDAPTKGKFYVRLDQGDSHVMWGNYKANIHGTEFLRSERALYGTSAVYRSEQVTPFGERRTEVRVDYERNEDESYYVFGQGTVKRSGDIGRNDRVGVGAEYQLTDKIALEGEVSYGTHGVGGEAGITYSPTADDNYYLTYRVDPDRAFDYDRTYDLSGTDKGTLVFGARRKVNDMLSAYTESNYDLYGRRNSLARTYGVTYTPDAIWTIDGGVEIGRINDDTINPDTGLERSDFDRHAISFAVSHKDEERGINGRVRAEARFEDSEDGTRDANTYLVGAGLSWKTSEDWRALFNIDAVLADASGESSFRDGDYVEASIGYAYRPVDNDRFNALFKYTWLYDMPGPDQVSAISGDEYGPAQRSHILSADFTYDLVLWLSVGAKYGFRYSEVRERVIDGRNTSFSQWQISTAHLGIIRGDLHIVNNWDALLEGRVMYMPEADTVDYGALAAIYRHVGDNLKLGVGYNFGSFSDDLRDLTLNDRGVFFNLVGTF